MSLAGDKPYNELTRLLDAILYRLENNDAERFLYQYHFGASAGVYPQEIAEIIDKLETALTTRSERGEDLNLLERELGAIGLVFLALWDLRQKKERSDSLTPHEDDIVRKIIEG